MMMSMVNILGETSFALALIFVSATVTFALLKGWNGWLALKRLELERPAPSAASEPDLNSPAMTARIEMAHLKERIRKLEAIAAGIDI